MKKIFLPALLLILLVAVSCHPDKPALPALGYRYCPKELLDYCIFKPGSYWIYQDTNTKRIDSVYVTATTHDTATATFNDGRSQKGDEYHMSFTDVYNGWKYQYSIPISYNINSPDLPVSWGIIIYGNSNTGFSGYTFDLNFPILFGTSGFFNNDSSSYCNDYLKLNINNISLDSVIYLKHSLLEVRASSFHYLGRRCKEYYARHYGLVRYELPDSNQVWNLLRYKLNQ